MMTAQQIKWAASHDWFIAPTKDEAGVVAEEVAVQKDGAVTREVKTFRDFRTLRAWAGY